MKQSKETNEKFCSNLCYDLQSIFQTKIGAVITRPVSNKALLRTARVRVLAGLLDLKKDLISDLELASILLDDHRKTGQFPDNCMVTESVVSFVEYVCGPFSCDKTRRRWAYEDWDNDESLGKFVFWYVDQCTRSEDLAPIKNEKLGKTWLSRVLADERLVLLLVNLTGEMIVHHLQKRGKASDLSESELLPAYIDQKILEHNQKNQ